MSVWAIGMVKDEGDIVRDTVCRMAKQVDHVLVADNGSTDDTREILTGIGAEVVDDPEVAYHQSEKMSRLVARALAAGVEWLVPFDADEVHCCTGGLGGGLQQLPDEVLVSEAVLFDHVATAIDPQVDSPVERMGWRRDQPVPLRKVACRARRGMVIHQGNHGVTYPDIAHPPSITNLVQVRHFPYRSVRQFVRKVRNGAAAYAASDLPEDVGAHWRGYGRILNEKGVEGLAEVFREWFWSADPDAEGLMFDPCP